VIERATSTEPPIAQQRMPVGDWQFWAASVIALVGLWLVLRPLLPRRGAKKGAACPGCPSGAAGALQAARPKAAALTIEGRRVD
jgi:hypothetical protein